MMTAPRRQLAILLLETVERLALARGQPHVMAEPLS